MNHDDGNLVKDIMKSDIILLGVSRTSKTPTSIYLANKGFKISNIPLVNENSIPEILKEDPSHSDANHNFGLLTVKLGEPAMGVQFLRTAIETDPTVADYWISIINTLMEIKDFENAKVALEKAKEVGHIGGVFEKLASNLEFLRNEKVEIESV